MLSFSRITDFMGLPWGSHNKKQNAKFCRLSVCQSTPRSPEVCAGGVHLIIIRQQYTMKLVKFLQKLNREQVTIELKNGTVISGTVVGVDATMNAHLKKAKMTARGKNPVSYATLSVRGSTVRAWLLPDGLNLDALLVEESTKVRSFFFG